MVSYYFRQCWHKKPNPKKPTQKNNQKNPPNKTQEKTQIKVGFFVFFFEKTSFPPSQDGFFRSFCSTIKVASTT